MLKIILTLLVLSSSAIAQTNNPITVVIPGECDRVVLGSRQTECSNRSTAHMLIYSAWSNGRVGFTIILSDTRALTFLGESDRQPTPNLYILYLARVRIGSPNQTSLVSDVGGTCAMNLSTDGNMVYRVNCQAFDAGGNEYILHFRGTAPVRR